MTNLYRQFAKLFAADPLLVGAVLATDTIGCTIELPDGSLVKARGEATVGAKVFIRAGVVEGPAPDVAVVEIEI